MVWAPGQSGNPAGPAARRRFLGAVERAIATDNARRLRACAETLLDRAAEGEPWAVVVLRDTLDGKPRQQVDVSGDGSPMLIQVLRLAQDQDGAVIPGHAVAVAEPAPAGLAAPQQRPDATQCPDDAQVVDWAAQIPVLGK